MTVITHFWGLGSQELHLQFHVPPKGFTRHNVHKTGCQMACGRYLLVEYFDPYGVGLRLWGARMRMSSSVEQRRSLQPKVLCRALRRLQCPLNQSRRCVSWFWRVLGAVRDVAAPCISKNDRETARIRGMPALVAVW